MKARLAAIFLLAFSAAGSAQWKDESGKPIADNEWRKSKDGLGGMLVLAGNYNEFIKSWASGDENTVAQVKPVTELKHGDNAAVLIFFAGCGKPAEKCTLDADIKVIAPDGSTYGDLKDRKAFDAVLEKPENLSLSNAMAMLRIEPNDKPGVYQVLATLRRPSTKTTIELKQTVRVVP